MTNHKEIDVAVCDTANHPLAKYVSALPAKRPEDELYTGQLWFDLAVLQRIVNSFLQRMDFPTCWSATKTYIASLAPEDLAMARGAKLLAKAAESLRDGRASFVLGMLHQECGNTAEAFRQFSEATVRSPGAARAKYQAGMLLLERGLKKEAIQFFESAVAIAPSFGDARRILASLCRSKSPAESALHFATLMQHGPALDYDYRMTVTLDEGLEIVMGAYNGYDVFRVEGTFYAVPIQIQDITAASLRKARPRLLRRQLFVNQIDRSNALETTSPSRARMRTEARMPASVRQISSGGGRAIALGTQILIVGRRRLKRFVARSVRRLARSRRFAPSFLMPAGKMLERRRATWIVKRQVFAATSWQNVKSEIDLRTSRIQLIEENCHGYNLLRCRGWLFAVPQKLGCVDSVDLHWALLRQQGRRSGSILVGRTRAELRRALDEAHDGPSFTRRMGS